MYREWHGSRPTTKRTRFASAHPCHECGKPSFAVFAWVNSNISKLDTNRRRCVRCQNIVHTKQKKAIGQVAAAIRRGLLPPAKTLVCVDCGAQARDWEHRDYNKPLDVVPVCRPCNFRRGPAIPLKAAA